jgi:hypothetical protein
MSRNIISVLMYHHQKLLDLMYIHNLVFLMLYLGRVCLFYNKISNYLNDFGAELMNRSS